MKLSFLFLLASFCFATHCSGHQILFKEFNNQKLSKDPSRVMRHQRWWAFFHPFSAPAAHKLTKNVLETVRKLDSAGTLGHGSNGGNLDAFKHTLWMAVLVSRLKPKVALKLGIAHEKDNKISFRKFESNLLNGHDSMGTVMDLWNNMLGAEIGTLHPTQDMETNVFNVLESIQQGRGRILLKDAKGNFLDCRGQVIPQQEFIGKWNIPKCLVQSGSGLK